MPDIQTATHNHLTKKKAKKKSKHLAAVQTWINATTETLRSLVYSTATCCAQPWWHHISINIDSRKQWARALISQKCMYNQHLKKKKSCGRKHKAFRIGEAGGQRKRSAVRVLKGAKQTVDSVCALLQGIRHVVSQPVWPSSSDPRSSALSQHKLFALSGGLFSVKPGEDWSAWKYQ